MDEIRNLIGLLSGFEAGDLVAQMEIEDQCRSIQEDPTVTAEMLGLVERVTGAFPSNLVEPVDEEIETHLEPLIDAISTAIESAHPGATAPDGQSSEPGTMDVVGVEPEGTTLSPLEFNVLITFLSEAHDHLDGIESKILQVESVYDSEHVNDIFRSVHTIKGSAGILRLSKIQTLAHSVETLLDSLRTREESIESDVIDILLNAMDTLLELVGQVEEHAATVDNTKECFIPEPTIDINSVVAAVEATKNGDGQRKLEQSTPSDPEETTPIDGRFVAELLREFVQETQERCEQIEADLLLLEGDARRFDVYDELFRSLHSIKGNAGLLLSAIHNVNSKLGQGVARIKEETHKAETAVQLKRDNEEPLGDSEIERLLKLVDDVRTRSGELERIAADDADGGENTPQGGNTAWTAGDETAEHAHESNGFAGMVSQSIELVRNGIALLQNGGGDGYALIQRGTDTLSSLGNRVKHDSLTAETDKMLSLLTAIDRSEAETSVETIGQLEAAVESIEIGWDRRAMPAAEDDDKSGAGPAGMDAAETHNAAGANGRKTLAQTLKVSEERLNMMLNFVNELFVSKNNLNEIKRTIATSGFTQEAMRDLEVAVNNISKNTDDLQSCIMDVRLMPVNVVFSRFPRMVRDIAKKLGKNINLSIKGEETELDKTMLDQLADPLVHLVRNAIDHGIDSPEERLRKGKPESGTVKLSAYNLGQNVCIEIADDGRGIDSEKVVATAIKRKILTAEDADRLDEQAILQLIFAPGFSTAGSVSDLSGRGVGMDVVRTQIDKFGGVIDIDTEQDVGTRIILKLPITLAINRGLEVEASGERYYVPLEYVEETVKIRSGDLSRYKNRQVTVVREELVDVFDLGLTLDSGMQRQQAERAASDISSTELSLVILNINGRKVGLSIDKCFRETEYMLRPLPTAVQGIDYYSGVTITGKGEVVLVLNPLGLLAA